MTCKFCGSTLDDNVVECPYCGHKTGVAAPANPEAEMTDRFAAESGREERRSASGSERKSAFASFGSALTKGLNRGSSDSRKNASGGTRQASGQTRQASGSRNLPVSSNGLIAIGLVACLLLCLISIISVAGMKKDLEAMNQDMLSLFYQIQNSTDKLQAKVEALERSVGNVSTTITDQVNSRNITITKEPTSVATYVGRGAENDTAQNVPIFTIYAQGFDLKFTWQRYDDASGEWIDITLDNDSNNSVYGLHVYTDATKGYSELSAHGVTQAAFGTYRCQIADSYGIKNSASIILSERSRDE